MTDSPRILSVLKQDGFGRVELIECRGARVVRRVACGGPWPGSRIVAKLLLRREKKALLALSGLASVPARIEDERLERCPSADGLRPDPGVVLLRSWIEGTPLWQARELASDFFDRLADLVRAVHDRGVCHNDLHKENNVLVDPAGRPALVDFQLASVHERRGRRFRRRCAEDLRHVAKHARRYETEGADRGPMERSLGAALWRRFVKPVYNFATRRLLRSRGEPRRPRGGPWPVRSGPLGPDPRR
ncbi:MAG: hypothetical protein Fur0037_05020 [Planctomycetota bacterium]